MKITNLSQDKIAAKEQTGLTEEENMVLDSLVNRFGAIEVAGVYQNSLAGYYPEEEAETAPGEEYEALEEYITLMAPSYPGLIAEELTNNR